MYLENNRGKVYYEVHGPPNAFPVIFTHGINMNSETFKAQADSLQEQYRVILWDLPDHGQSSFIDHKLPFSETAADFIVDLLAQLNIEKAVLAGLSLGSYITQLAAYKYPDKVKATIHIGGGSLYPPVNSLLKMINPLVGLLIKLYPRGRVFKDFASHRALKPETKAYMERVAEQNGKNVMNHVTQELIRDMVRGLPHYTAELKLLCHGDQEIAFVQKQMRRWHEESENSQLKIIDNAHHVANMDNPEQMNSVLREFLDQVVVPE